MTRVYLAGASKEVDALVDLAVRLNNHPRIEVHDRWMHDVIRARAAGVADHAFARHEQRRFATADLEDLRRADVFWLAVPKEKGSVGAWVELGHALAHRHLHIVVSGDLNRSIFIHACDRAKVFHDHELALTHILEGAS